MALLERRSIRKYLIWFLVVSAILLSVFVYITVFFTYSEGFRAGQVVKLSSKGFLIKTVEGQMYTGAVANSPGAVRDAMGGNIWEFTVEGGKNNLAKQIEDAVSSGKRVKLHYHEKLYQFNWRGDTKYFIHKVEDVQ